MATEEPLLARLLPHHRPAIAEALLFLKAVGISLLPTPFVPLCATLPAPVALLVFIVTREEKLGYYRRYYRGRFFSSPSFCTSPYLLLSRVLQNERNLYLVVPFVN